MLKAGEWSSLVHGDYPDSKRRTGDLNHCQGYADGDKQIAGILARYNDPQKYELKKLSFNADLVARLDPNKNISEPW
jgi:hypothetical protein